jgi:hypothetical protein
MKPTFCASCLFLLVVSGSIAQQRPQVPHVTGFFSDMSYIPEAGDVVGTEVWIVYARGGYYASVQIAEGEPDPPYLVPVEVTGLTGVKFKISQPLKSGRKAGPPAVIEFKGTVGNAGLMLSAPERRLLKRRSSYWQ